MSMSAEKERKAEDQITGVDKRPRSRAFWHDSFIEEFALMARKLRKGQDYDRDGKLVRGDRYARIIERKAAEMETDEQLKDAADKVRKNLPGAHLNQLVRKAREGGFVDEHGALNRDLVWA
jgi:hypothetical protein